MGPVREEEEEKDDGIPKVLCQMDNHLGMLTLSLLAATFSRLPITYKYKQFGSRSGPTECLC